MHLLVTGQNGAGKSTLLLALAGDFDQADPPVLTGRVHRSRGLRVGLLEQDPRLGGESRTPRQVLALISEDDRVDAAGLIAPRDLDRPIGHLSVGQRRRVLLALLLAQEPDVLLLDEPTNHLSLTLADDLMAALANWPGTVVVASHDRWLRRHWDAEVLNLAATPSPEAD